MTDKNHRVLIHDIQAAACRHFKVSREQLLMCRERSDGSTRRRQIAMYVAHRVCGKSLPKTGRAFARDHTTVQHAARTIGTMIADGRQDIARDVAGVLLQLHQGRPA